MEPTEKALSDYFGKHRILIADSNASSRTGIARAIVELGAKTHQITLVDSFEWAQQIIEQSQPTMLITDFNLGSVGAFDLFQHPKYSAMPMQDKLSVVVTNNTSQAAVAQAAEGDVDIYIAKPYSLEGFWSALKAAAALKLQPTEYLKAIEDGKRHLADSNLSRAVEIFERATTMDGKPALAYFYHGYAKALGNALEDAQESYRKGLEYNRNHYKCLLGLYEALMDQKRNHSSLSPQSEALSLRALACHHDGTLRGHRAVLSNLLGARRKERRACEIHLCRADHCRKILSEKRAARSRYCRFPKGRREFRWESSVPHRDHHDSRRGKFSGRSRQVLATFSERNKRLRRIPQHGLSRDV